MSHDQDITIWKVIKFVFGALYFLASIFGAIVADLPREGLLALTRLPSYTQTLIVNLKGFWWDFQASIAWRRNGNRSLCWQCNKLAGIVNQATFVQTSLKTDATEIWTSRPLKTIDRTATHCDFCQGLASVAIESLGKYYAQHRYVALLRVEDYMGLAPDPDRIDPLNRVQDGNNLVPTGHECGVHTTEEATYKTRRLRVGFKEPEYPDRKHSEDFQLVLLAEDAPDPFMYGRRLDPQSVDISLLQSWITLCEKSHKRCQASGSRFTGDPRWEQPSLRVIDVVERRLCTIHPANNRYAALSYVWGAQASKFMCTNESISSLLCPRGLVPVLSKVPQTIQDAMELVERLGERYLWVDQLCIIQDDREDRNKIISAMAAIYSSAFVTIIAASGADSDAGLPGVRFGSRNVAQTVIELQPQLRLMLQNTADNHPHKIGESAYETRAWTFEERLLSRRSLVFLGDRVYFECRCMCCREDEVTERPGYIDKRSHMSALPSQIMDDQPFLSIYAKIILRYTRRELTHQRDVLNAFDAAARVLSTKLGSEFHYGLFTSHFDLALLWHSANPLERRNGFPSWSWAGWKGPVAYALRMGILTQPAIWEEWLKHKTWIEWYRLDYDGVLHQISHLGSDTQASAKTNPDVLNVAEESSEATISTSTASSKSTRNQPASEPTSPTYPTQHHKILALRDSLPLPDDYTLKTQGFPYLFFWTVTLHLRLTLQPKPQIFDFETDLIHNTGLLGNGICRLGLENAQQTWCGSVVVDDEWQRRVGETHEFVILSKCMGWDNENFDLEAGISMER